MAKALEEQAAMQAEMDRQMASLDVSSVSSILLSNRSLASSFQRFHIWALVKGLHCTALCCLSCRLLCRGGCVIKVMLACVCR